MEVSFGRTAQVIVSEDTSASPSAKVIRDIRLGCREMTSANAILWDDILNHKIVRAMLNVSTLRIRGNTTVYTHAIDSD